MDHEHTWVAESFACVECGYVDQMTFEDVVDLEPIHGDPSYNAWLAAGRPKLDGDVRDNGR